MTIGKRLNLFVVAAIVLSTALISAVFIIQLSGWAEDEVKSYRQEALEAEKTKLKGLVDTAISLVAARYALLGKNVKPEALKKQLMGLVKVLRYGAKGKDYFWINDMHPRMVMHPYKSSLDGKDLSDFKDPNGKRLFVEFARVCREKGQGYVDYYWPKYGAEKPVPKLSYVKLFKPLGWIIGTGLYIDRIDAMVKAKRAEINAQVRTMIVVSIIIALILIGLAVAFSLWFSRSITRPIKQIVTVSEAMAGGDLTKKIEYESKDEVGQLAGSLRDMLTGVIGQGQSIKTGIPDPFFITDKEMTIQYMNQACEQVLGKKNEQVAGKVKCHDLFQSDACAQGCVVKEAMETGQFITGRRTVCHVGGQAIPLAVSGSALKDLDGNIVGGMEFARDITADVEAENRIKEQQANLLEVAQEVTNLAEQLASASAEVSASTEQMSASAEQQSAQADTVATTTEEMSATVQEAAQTAAKGAEEARKAGEMAGEGGELANQTVNAINRISENATEVGHTIGDLAKKAEQINKVVDVIEDIADQTNLLALNAAIEAARAGEAGRGFAVVADEVRKLAEKTMTATKEVGETVQAIQDASNEAVNRMEEAERIVAGGVDLAKQTGEKLGHIVDNATNVGNMVSQIATASEEQSVATDEITKNVEGIATAAREVSSAVGETARTAEELSSMAARLTEVVAKFKA